MAGSTDWGVDVNLKGARARSCVAIDQVPELREPGRHRAEIRIGAALSLTEIERRPGRRGALLDAVFEQFASRLIRNGATLGGNLGTGSPIGDSPPALLALARARAGRRRRVNARSSWPTTSPATGRPCGVRTN